MIRDYQLVSPSLDGILDETVLSYEGLSRPVESMRIHDKPSKNKNSDSDYKKTEENRKVLESYFHDLYGVFMKNLSFFVVEAQVSNESMIKLQAMLQELIKVKKLIGD